MKVLQINAIYGGGSTGRTTAELDGQLRANGIESIIVTPNTNLRQDNIYKMGNKLDQKVHAFLSRLVGKQGYFSKRETIKLLHYIDAEKPDIIHLRNLHANYINLELLFNYLSKNHIPTVITLHDCWFYTGKCMHYTTQGCNRWKTGCYDCPKLKTDNVSWIFDRTQKMWNDKKKWFSQLEKLSVIGVSDWITNEARQSLLGNATIIQRIYNWIDLETFKPSNTEALRKKLGLEKKYILLGVAGGWGNKKGLDLFYKLSKQLSPDEIIVLVGGLSENQIPKEGLPANIMHIPETESVGELVSYYSMADVFLQLSKEETFGKVVAEALACGTPVITIDSTANSELVAPECGIVLQNLNDLMKAHKEIRKYGKNFYSVNCRKFAKTNFNMKDRTDEYISVYRELLKNDEKRK